MKIILFFFFLFSLSGLAAQTILNNNFEKGSSIANHAPAQWNFTIAKGNGTERHNLTEGFTGGRDRERYPGRYSLRIAVTDSTSFVFACTQRCALNISAPKRIRIVAWIKTKDCKQGAGLNCTQRNSKGEKIAYTSSRQQEVLMINTNEWRRTELIVLLMPEAKTIDIWAFVYGTGTAWFDDLAIEPIHNTCKTAPLITAYLDSVIKIVKNNSLYRDSINWNTFRNQMNALAKGMQTYKEARVVTGYILNVLHKYGDNHSSMMPPSLVKQFSTDDIQGKGRKVKSAYLGKGVGYISMPGFGSMNDSVSVAFATYAQEQIRKIDTENDVCSWVVDLRDDNGGSCPPMIAGLGPILGEGVFNVDRSIKNKIYTGIYQNGECYSTENGVRDPYSVKVLSPYKLKKDFAPVAILIGAGCGSSGEATVASFIGRRDTKLFGQPTAGYTKGNEDFILPDSSMLFISSGIQCDRNGKMYPDRIYPNVTVDEVLDDKKDRTLDLAKKWLVSMEKCD